MPIFDDPNWLILDNTLISAKLKGKKVRIPSTVNGEVIRRIGMHALIASQDVQMIEVSDDVEAVAVQFSNNESVMLNLPGHAEFVPGPKNWITTDPKRLRVRLRMSDAEYNRIQDSSIPIGEGKRLMCEGTCFTGCMNALNNAAQGILLPPRQIDTFFYEAGKADVFENIPTLSQTGRVFGTEDAYIRDLIRSHRKGFRFAPEKEYEIDSSMLRNKRDESHSDSAFDYAFMEPASRSGNEWISTAYSLGLKGMFYVTIESLKVRGKTYYVHFRNYLGLVQIYREAFSVYDDDGLVTNAKLSEEIYAKYRFVSLL